ncbi:hypothetical protein MNBD_GAMMA03-1615 [hydrothermal vent metagenome]|uniref:Uncharacterized protein n=1 Tax=hydrothermal vent metagenome TaxID=652676 RepID=A0A3B0W6D9_9ZZZZ
MKLNFKELRKSGLLNHLNNSEFKFSNHSVVLLKDKMPNSIDKISLYGNNLKRSGDVTLVMSGTFSDTEIINLIRNNLYTVNDVSQLKQVKTLNSRGHDIYAFELVNTIDKHKNKYAARLDNGNFVFSNNLSKIRFMLKKSG